MTNTQKVVPVANAASSSFGFVHWSVQNVNLKKKWFDRNLAAKS